MRRRRLGNIAILATRGWDRRGSVAARLPATALGSATAAAPASAFRRRERSQARLFQMKDNAIFSSGFALGDTPRANTGHIHPVEAPVPGRPDL